MMMCVARYNPTGCVVRSVDCGMLYAVNEKEPIRVIYVNLATGVILAYLHTCILAYLRTCMLAYLE